MPKAGTLPSNEDFMKIYVTKIHSTDPPDYDHFLYATQFGIEEPETYAKTMQYPNDP